MILLSAHSDVIKYPYKFTYAKGEFCGLLDNQIGCLMCQSLISEDANIQHLEKNGEISLFFGQGEEWGLTYDFPSLDKKKDIILVVDVASGRRYDKYDFALENISGFKDKEIKSFMGNLKWEGYNFLTAKYNADPELEDETYRWIEMGYKTISFCIPIQGESWHKEDCAISIEKFNKAKQGLKRLINYILP